MIHLMYRHLWGCRHWPRCTPQEMLNVEWVILKVLKIGSLTSCYSLVVRMGVSLVPDWKGYISKSQVSWKLLESEC